MARHKEAEREQVLSETRQSLLAAATQEFARAGYAKANINRISNNAGFAKGTIYNYFDSKRSLMLALIAEISTHHYEFIAAGVRKERDAGKRVERFFEAGYAFVKDHLAQAQVMVNNIYGPDPEFKLVMYEAYQPMFRLVGEEIIGYGVSQGIFRQVDPPSTAALVMNIYLGVASSVNEEGEPWLASDLVADFVLNALLRKGG